MQTAAPPTATRLHWIPVEPSLLVAAALIVLAVLPHQIPAPIRRVLRSWIGGALFVAVAVWVFWKQHRPVLGMAMALLLVGIWIERPEGFAAPVLNKDRVTTKRRWMGEEVMNEEPATIQERTENPALLRDKVSPEESEQQWHAERTLDEHPQIIQERPVPVQEYDSDTGGAGFGRHY